MFNPKPKGGIDMEQEVIEDVSLFEDNENPKTKVVEDNLTQKEKTSFQVPDKFKGKTVEDVVESYVNLEKELGQKGNEIGELRKLTDQILLNQMNTHSQAPEAGSGYIDDELGFDDFIDDPASAVNKALDSNPRLQKLEESLLESTREKARAVVINKHNDADELIASPKFLSWAQESPSRWNTLVTANNSNDASAVVDLISLYKMTQQVTTDEAVIERDAQVKADLKKATVETGSTPSKTKPRFRRAELIHLKIHDPARYAAKADEIREAYAEGRVI